MWWCVEVQDVSYLVNGWRRHYTGSAGAFLLLSEGSMTIEFGDTRLPERFWKKCTPEPMSGCWLWIGAFKAAAGRNAKYPHYSHEGRMRAVNQVLAEVFIPGYNRKEWQPVQWCENSLCVNPNHLELKDRSICNRGHKKTPNQPQCLECKAMTNKKYHETYARPKTEAATAVGGWKAKNTKQRRPEKSKSKSKSKPIEGYTVFGDEDKARDVWRPPGWSKEVEWWPGLREPTTQEQSPAKTA